MSINYKPAIHFNEVNYSVDNIHILKGITGSFPQGKITTLVGPSGAGKTTLLKLCNGLKSPTAGDIYISDKQISEYNPVELRHMVGIALQNAPMINGSVFKNLALPLELQGKQMSEKEAINFLVDVGLDEEILHRNIRDLSGGNAKRYRLLVHLSIARKYYY